MKTTKLHVHFRHKVSRPAVMAAHLAGLFGVDVYSVDFDGETFIIEAPEKYTADGVRERIALTLEPGQAAKTWFTIPGPHIQSDRSSQ